MFANKVTEDNSNFPKVKVILGGDCNFTEESLQIANLRLNRLPKETARRLNPKQIRRIPSVVIS